MLSPKENALITLGTHAEHLNRNVERALAVGPFSRAAAETHVDAALRDLDRIEAAAKGLRALITAEAT